MMQQFSNFMRELVQQPLDVDTFSTLRACLRNSTEATT